MSTSYSDFEFERRFLVRRLPDVLRDAPSLIVQSYFLSDGGYALRVRVQAGGVDAGVDAESDPAEIIDAHREQFDFAAVTVKGPSAGGTRYEAERQLDPLVGVELVRRGGARVVKTRYAVWLGADGWSVDVFGGANSPLVVAECERSGPVTALQIPDFCVTEITDERRFSNESLAVEPYGEWAAEHAQELARTGPRFRDDFGENQRLESP
ncbi:CYTH domain-containing protein [Isoptericola sp. S6320L]|uniref:CYTH domain-containing protein n=1 Tax=Isoptericola sp. S6320L TaxID=2926411 RepID=UPI001FF58BBB|nr:CYTH domain-containing protein [Isoptericola sp. S6320L]MCK0116142.1 CYTH domain-containing protein [Isoptericola sp. S6320L]